MDCPSVWGGLVFSHGNIEGRDVGMNCMELMWRSQSIMAAGA